MDDERDGGLSPQARDLLVLRETLARELQTINEYERAIQQAASPEVRQLLAHLRDEEKEHVAECVLYIRRLDPAQERFFLAEEGALLGGTLRGGASASGPTAAQPAAPSPAVRTFTVGSLKRRPPER